MTTDQPFTIEWAGPALRALDRLPEKVATAAVEFVYGPLADNPVRVNHPLRFDLEGVHSARRGDHGVLYRIEVSGALPATGSLDSSRGSGVATLTKTSATTTATPYPTSRERPGSRAADRATMARGSRAARGVLERWRRRLEHGIRVR